MASYNISGLNVCEIDASHPTQISTNSCDIGKWTSNFNNCFINFESVKDNIPRGSHIDSATLRIYKDGGGYSQSISMRVRLCSGGWAAFSWNSQPAVVATGGVLTSTSGTGSGDVSFDVRDIVQWIVDNNNASHIWKIERATNTNTLPKDAKSFTATASAHDLLINYTAPTSPSAPSGLGFNANPFESSVRLSWSKGSNGTYNAITGYELRYQTSSNGSSWSGETVVSLGSGSTYYDLNTSGWGHGTYLRFRVGSKSSYASTVYSGYVTARKNRVPNAPTNASVPKTSYIPGETIRVSFTNNGDPDGNLSGFEAAMQYANGTWYNGGQIMGSRSGSTITYVDISTTGWSNGAQWKFFVRGYDTYGVRGSWSNATAVVTMNEAPLTPSIGYPVTGGTVFNRRPRILLTAAATNDGVYHIAQVMGARGGWLPTNSDYSPSTLFSCGATNSLSSQRKIAFKSDVDSDTVVGSNTVKMRMYDGALYSGEVSRQFNVAALAFTDPDLTVPNMKIRAVHVTELQTAISTIRTAYGLAAVSWKPVTSNSTKIGDDTIITQMQTAMQDIINLINGWDSATSMLDISVTWVSVTEPGGVSGVKLRQALEQLRAILPTI